MALHVTALPLPHQVMRRKKPGLGEEPSPSPLLGGPCPGVAEELGSDPLSEMGGRQDIVAECLSETPETEHCMWDSGAEGNLHGFQNCQRTAHCP